MTYHLLNATLYAVPAILPSLAGLDLLRTWVELGTHTKVFSYCSGIKALIWHQWRFLEKFKVHEQEDYHHHMKALQMQGPCTCSAACENVQRLLR